MKNLFNILIVFMLSMLFTVVAFAQANLPTDVMGNVDWAAVIGAMIANPKAMTAAFIGALVVLVIVQTMKHPKLGSFYKFLDPKLQFAIVTLLGQVYGLLIHVFILKDQETATWLVGLFSSGGAAALFNAFQLVFLKKKAEAPALELKK